MKVTMESKIKVNKFKAIQGAVISDLANAMYVEAELIMTDSKVNYVPVDTGQLRNSGTVLPAEIKNNQVSVILGYGGASAPYAAKIHEAPPRWGQGKNKYLSKPLNKASAGMTQRLSDAIARRVRSR